MEKKSIFVPVSDIKGTLLNYGYFANTPNTKVLIPLITFVLEHRVVSKVIEIEAYFTNQIFCGYVSLNLKNNHFELKRLLQKTKFATYLGNPYSEILLCIMYNVFRVSFTVRSVSIFRSSIVLKVYLDSQNLKNRKEEKKN